MKIKQYLATLYLVIVIVVLPFSTASAQTLRIEKSFWGTKLYADDQLKSPAEILEVMKSDPKAYQEFKKAKGNLAGATVLGFIGGGLIGWPIGTSLGGGDPQWGLAGGGVALILLSIPLISGFNKHAEKAIELYNSDSQTSHKISIGVLPYGAGAKLVIRF